MPESSAVSFYVKWIVVGGGEGGDLIYSLYTYLIVSGIAHTCGYCITTLCTVGTACLLAVT